MTSRVQPERFSLAVVKNVGSFVNHIIVEAIVDIKILDRYVAGRLFAQAHNIRRIVGEPFCIKACEVKIRQIPRCREPRRFFENIRYRRRREKDNRPLMRNPVILIILAGTI